MGVKDPRRRWRLVFDMDGREVKVLQVSKGAASVADAVTLFRAAVRAAMEKEGCQTVMVGVHVEGAECDHEVGP